MGMLGEVFSIRAYIGTESLRLFRKIEADGITDPGEFFASQHSVYVSSCPKRSSNVRIAGCWLRWAIRREATTIWQIVVAISISIVSNHPTGPVASCCALLFEMCRKRHIAMHSDALAILV
jgi:hypothetical protein